MSKQQTAGQRPMRLTTSCPSIVFADVRAGCCRPAFVTLETRPAQGHSASTSPPELSVLHGMAHTAKTVSCVVETHHDHTSNKPTACRIQPSIGFRLPGEELRRSDSLAGGTGDKSLLQDVSLPPPMRPPAASQRSRWKQL